MIIIMKFLSWLTNRYSMLFLMQAYLVLLVTNAVVFSLLKFLPYNPINILFNAAYLVVIALTSSFLFAKLMKADASHTSAVVTALILSLIVGPVPITGNFAFLAFLAILAMGSKYIFAWRSKHFFNPAALTVVIGALLLNNGASWWVGSISLLPLTILGGIVIIHKIQRWQMVMSFLALYLSLTIVTTLLRGGTIETLPLLLKTLVLYGPLLFFSLVMLVEPLTSPTKRTTRIMFGLFAALVLVLLQTFAKITYSLELALLIGNVFAWIVGTSHRNRFVLQEIRSEGTDSYSFRFTKPVGFHFKAGQYMEWSLRHPKTDSRGSRRWFTIASSPTEDQVMLAARISNPSSSFKQALSGLQAGHTISALGPEGDFVLPKDMTKPLIWIAGGIGVTPFRSMAQDMVDTNQHRHVTLFYANRSAESTKFKETLDRAVVAGVTTVYAFDEAPTAQERAYETGPITIEMISRHVPNYVACLFYISGPEPMVRSMEQLLRKAGVQRRHIKCDYFPGYSEGAAH